MSEVPAEIHGFSRPGAVPTPWEVGREQVAAADTFWLSTVRSGGAPHVTPLIAVWEQDALWFATGEGERKAHNLAQNPACVLTTGASDLADGALDVVLEGVAERAADGAPELEAVAAAFAAKYGTEIWDYEVRDGVFVDADSGRRILLFRVAPTRGLGFRKGDDFSQTTWRFPG
jgi:nitroimidazol reductase NimA-like FMN-containing flavoprotein (pyridoxamine 5'-phosphate oxidase superfamily)